jgi:hypothetical protein
MPDALLVNCERIFGSDFIEITPRGRFELPRCKAPMAFRVISKR